MTIHDNGGTASSPRKIKKAARELLRLLGEGERCRHTAKSATAATTARTSATTCAAMSAPAAAIRPQTHDRRRQENMTTKTPEQIAAQIINENYEDQGAPHEYPATENLNYLLQHGEVDADDIEALLIAAIKADRAQRKIVNWDEAGQLVQAYHEAADSWSGDAEHDAAMEIVSWVEYALEGGAR